MAEEKTQKVVLATYFGRYGPSNFWSSFLDYEVEYDSKFLVQHRFNQVVLLVPFSLFRVRDGGQEKQYFEKLNFVASVMSNAGLKVVLRAGFLWEASFEQDRTFELYLKMMRHLPTEKITNISGSFIDLLIIALECQT